MREMIYILVDCEEWIFAVSVIMFGLSFVHVLSCREKAVLDSCLTWMNI